MSKSNKTDPWAKIDALIQNEGKLQGEGWLSRAQFAQRYGLSPESGAIRRKLKRMVDSGLLEKAAVQGKCLTVYYRPVA